MIDCKIIKNIGNTSVIKACDSIDERLVRLQTVFMYPEGSYVDVFLGMHDPPTSGFHLTDMGQTLSYLADLHISVHESRECGNIAEQVCNLLNIHEKDGELFTPIREDLSDAGDAILRLSQACMRIADLQYVKRFRQTSRHKGGINDILVTGDLDGGQLLEVMNVILERLDKLASETFRPRFETEEGLRRLLREMLPQMVKKEALEEGMSENW